MARYAFCILGAMMGAGFASGREIMAFFSRFGPLSRWLICLTSALMGWMMNRIMKMGGKGMAGLFPGKSGCVSRWMTIALLAAAGGGMTAASGELIALVLPWQGSCCWGWILTLLGCAFLSKRTLNALSALGRMLLPLIAAAFLLCMRLPGGGAAFDMPEKGEIFPAILGAIGYAGFNSMLTAGVLCQAGADCSHRSRCRLSVWTAGGAAGMMLLGNQALLQQGACMEKEALPIVRLLAAYGRFGYYLSAGVLYLSIVTTLIAVLQGMREMLPEGRRHPSVVPVLLCAGLGRLGFERIVASAYPFFGILGMMMLLWPSKRGNALNKCITPCG